MLDFQTFQTMQLIRCNLTSAATPAAGGGHDFRQACPNEADAAAIARALQLLDDIIREDLELSQVCRTCGHRRWHHRASDLRCPHMDPSGVVHGHGITYFQ